MTPTECENEVQYIVDAICIDDDIQEAFTSKGYKYKEMDSGEDRDDYSTNVNWNLTFVVQKCDCKVNQLPK